MSGAGNVTPVRVSVVVAAYDAERYLAEALRSILDQTRAVDEVIVVDDGSTDATGAVARSFGPPVTVIEGPHRGAGPARNTGMATATGSVICLCDADDLWRPTKVEAQLAALEAIDGSGAGRAVAVFCGVEEFVSPEIADAYRGRAPRNGVERARFASALLATRSTFEGVGPFGTGSFDWVDWCARLADGGGEVHHLPAILVRRRLHLGNSTLGTADPAAMAPALAARLHRLRGRT